MSKDIEVSIICNAYNHEKYIRKCLEGFVIQKTNFNYEVLVHDDASTDKTAEIIKEYEFKYPDIINPIYENENQYSKKDGSIARIQYGRAKGKYIAFCEGDDYWNDPLKLQKQYDVLELNSEIDMCAHSSFVHNCINGKTTKIIRSNVECIIPVQKVILGGGGFVATNSLFYRKTLRDNPPKFRRILSIDYTMQIDGAMRGGLYYLPECMSTYNYMVEGSWSRRITTDKKLNRSTNEKWEAMLEQLDEDTNHKYSSEIRQYSLKSLITPYKSYAENRAILKKYYREMANISKKEQIKIYCKCFFPWVFRIKHTILRLRKVR